ncbi:hypothetical protein ES703_67145 [subsurface metagenome]
MSKGKLEEIFFNQKQLEELMANEKISIVGKVVAVLENKKTGKKKIIHGFNVVTDKGDKYYAQSAVAETPDDDFDAAVGGLRLGSNNAEPAKGDGDVTAFLAGSAHALDAAYPKTNDDDPDNTGKGVDIVTWRFSYTTAEGNVNGIIEGAIVDDRTTPTGALSHFLFAAAFDKTASDTLKVFVNHTFNGV